MPIIRARHAGLAVATAGALLLAGAGAAGAHVTVSSPDASAGGYGKLIFRVPNESDTASTTHVSVTLPADTPFPSVRTQEVPGWTAEVDVAELAEPVEVGDLMLSEAPSTVTWTATGDPAIGPHDFAEFALSVGPLPDEAGTDAVPVASTGSDDTSDALARTLGGAGLVLGGVALGLVLAARRRSTT